jgi:predicted short-subunit dehydrogenase-like oxidoreductase (DUF2520 family)
MAALRAAGGYTVMEPLGRGRWVAGAAEGVDVLVIATPDTAVAGIAARVVPNPDAVVVHLSGSLGLDVLAPHPRRASLHPLVPLPNPEIGAVRLQSGVTFTVAGDPAAREMAEAMGGCVVEVADELRANYHTAATVAANHLVALLGQVERIAATAGLPLTAFAGLIRAAAEDGLALGPRPALTGPASRGDWATMDRHRSVLGSMPGGRTELAAYDAMADLARRLSMDTPDLGLAAAAAGDLADGSAGGELAIEPVTTEEQVA